MSLKDRDAQQALRREARYAHDRGPLGPMRPRLGTFGGVFTPSILTILGIILFRRLGFIVGSVGAAQALVMLALATSISVLTSLSLAAIATNRKIKGGGDYYLISRSLGVEYGGALGFLLFVAQAVSVAFYCVGLGEALASAAGWPASAVRPTAAAATGILFVVAFVGADLATRLQYAIMAVLVAAIASFFAGAAALWDPATLSSGWRAPGNAAFWPLFAVFFPAVTGFTQGVSMSGDLEDASKSLPRGTFWAVGVSTLVYVAAILALAAAAPLSMLAADYDAMGTLATHARLIDLGVLSATASSALASLLGAPRVLQALAADGLFASLAPFARGYGAARNPRPAVVLTAAVALATIAVGDLDSIARLVSMFFLISYGLLNYATYVEAIGASPSFRPRFRFFHARASLLGTLLCAGVMFAIDWAAGVLALGLLGATYQYLRRTAVPARWRDSRRAYRFRRVKQGIRELASQAERPTDWQPHILVFTDAPERRERVLRLASWISGGSGMITACRLLEGDSTSGEVRRQCREAEAELQADIERSHLDAFALAVAAPDLRAAAQTLLQAWGIGPIRANTVMLNWYESRDTDDATLLSLKYARVLRRAIRLDQSLAVVSAEEGPWSALVASAPEKRRIDVWWLGDDSSRLALLFAYLVTRDDEWDEATIRLLAPVRPGAEEETRSALAARLEELRIHAEVEPIPDACAAVMCGRSADASLVLLPLRTSGLRVRDPFGGPIEALLAELPVVVMVAAAADVEISDEEEETEEAAQQPQEGAAADEVKPGEEPVTA